MFFHRIIMLRLIAIIHNLPLCSESVWGVLTGAVKSASSPLITRSVREVEIWILKLLSAPAPIPGRTCLQVGGFSSFFVTVSYPIPVNVDSLF